jgi:uncharacterized protein
MHTCEAVIAEACHLVRRLPAGPRAVLDLIQDGVIAVRFRLEDHLGRVVSLLRRYADRPMSLADACLVCMSEIAPEGVIFTLDEDFRTYRRHGRQTIPVLMAPR